MKRRVFLIVLDSFGIGHAVDAVHFGDEGSNTLEAISSHPDFRADNLRRLGLFNIDKNKGDAVDTPIGAYGRLSERSMGKDTTIGHWEIAGIISNDPLPTYPEGFPSEIIEEFSRQTGRGVLCNKPYSGTQVIRDYGEEHLKTGDLIVYTSADSVFQIAAHEDIVPPEQLYEYCRIARKILCGKHGVGRVIARPYIGTHPDYTRTSNRHDFSIEPPEETMLDILSKNGFDTPTVGKINDIFLGRGISEANHISSNNDGMNKISEYQKKDFCGLCFINLVDFDSLWGHRNDVSGYAKGISEFDSWLGGFIEGMRDSDILIITADHGCDPSTESTDHSREDVPLLVYGKDVRPVDLGARRGFNEIAKTVCEIFGCESTIDAEGFKELIL
ncbi:MAG: phosphopentomutase [Ruminococcaceae bacterium]|nr:phosphopentomutase [Oscillospiraceae bacterium]